MIETKHRLLKVLQPVSVYSDCNATARTSTVLPVGELVWYRREVYREGEYWFMLRKKNGAVTYVKKDKESIRECEKVKLSDKRAIGMDFTHKNGADTPLKHLLFREGTSKLPVAEIGTVQFLYETSDANKKHKILFVNYEYDKRLIDVCTVEFTKGDKFYITNLHAGPFTEVIDFAGRRGYLRYGITYKDVSTKWLEDIFKITLIVLLILGFVAALSEGYVVGGLFLTIPALLISGGITLFVFIFAKVFSWLRKRF